MRPHHLRLTAFGAFGGTAEVSFDALASSGLFLLHGETGAGKTTLLDAIGFALYGRVPGERGKARRLRSDHAAAGARTEVTLEATVGGRRLRITRRPEQERPKKSGKGTTTERASVTLEELAACGEWEVTSARAGEADAEIAGLMGMSAEQFFQVVLLPQGQFARFLHADAEARARLLQKLFGTDRFRAVEDWLAERRRSMAHQVAEAEQEVARLAARVAQVAGVPVPGDERDAARPGNGQAAGTEAGGSAPAGLAAGGPGTGASPAVGPAAVSAAPGARSPAVPEAGWAAGLAAAAAAEAAAAGRAADARKHELDAALAGLRKAEELAGRQRRRADALRRHSELSAAEPDVGALRREADAAARAAEVAPALGAADRAEAALASAREAEENARAAASAAGLPAAATAREFRAAAEDRQQRIGRLEGLRELADRASGEDALAGKARERAAVLADQLTGCERSIAEQRARRERLAADREAAHLAGQRLPGVRAEADRRRAAATDAAALAGARAQERALKEAHLAAREKANDLREQAQRLREARFDGMIAELAAALVDGTPCPVCGSLDHPDPSQIRAGHVTHDEEERAAAEADAAREAAERAAADVAAARARASELAARLARSGLASHGQAPAAADGAAAGSVAAGPGAAETGSGTSAGAGGAGGPGAVAQLADAAWLGSAARSLAAEASVLDEEAAGLEAAAGRLGEHDRELADLDAAIAGEEKRQSALEQQRRAALDEAEAAEQRAAGCRESLRAQLGSAPDLDTALASARALAGALGCAARAIEATVSAAREAELASEAAERAAVEAGFTGADAARAAVRPAGWRAEAQARIRDHERESGAVQALLADPELDVPLDPPAGVADAEASVTAVREAHDAAVDSCGRARDRAGQLAALAPELDAALAALEPLRERAGEVRRLADLAAGMGANTLKMTLSSFVLAARLEEVADAASQRLLRMTAGRYSLAHTDARRGAGRAGLGLLACDAWTGQERDTSTLSGGETFLASLALALGLADVVTAEAGGVRIEALFVDEGFGSLDEDTLEEVMTVLDGLREGGRMVGIVSHVSELRQRVPAQVRVRKGRGGSHVELITA
jgi:exonuclease SbcC